MKWDLRSSQRQTLGIIAYQHIFSAKRKLVSDEFLLGIGGYFGYILVPKTDNPSG